MGIGVNFVTQHALRRIRERWPSTACLTQSDLLRRVSRCLKEAERRGEMVRAPGGTYVPFSVMDEEGFLVLRKKAVVTAVGADWCPEVNEYLEKKRNDNG